MKSTRLPTLHHLLIAVVFTLMILGLLIVANLGMDVLNCMRAYVGGEGLWSKGQKDAVHYLLRYSASRSESDFERYRQAISVPLADHDARIAFGQSPLDQEKVAHALIAGGNHPADVARMIQVYLLYHAEPHLGHAIKVWTEGDKLLQHLSRLGTQIRNEITKPEPDQNRIAALAKEVDELNERFPPLENDFSRSLGDAARNARSVVFNMLISGGLFALLLGLFVSYRLIVRAREADEQYRHLFETASDGVIIADNQSGVILDANAKLAELTGLPIPKLLGVEQRSLFGREIPAVHRSSDLAMGDLVIRNVSGVSIPVDVRISQGHFRRRHVDYSVVRDIRERRQMEAQLQEAARLESIGRLAAGIAHDFNNLLTVICGYAERLQRASVGEAREKSDQILEASQRATGLVRQLLAFSRKQPLQPQPLDLNRLIMHLRGMIRGVLNKEIELVLELEPELGTVEADPRQLEQVLLNLAANARDAMPFGGSLIIRTWNNSGAEKYVGLLVSDTGQGMDEATLSRIFEPFFTTKPEGKGTGLGLATVYGTVRQSRGQISVESKVGKGTTFRILLPRTKKVLKTEIQGPVNAIPADGKTVLLIEDDAGVQQVLARGLKQEGYIVTTASNGREAVELLRLHRDRFSVIVTDLIMPEMGGTAVGRWLREAGFGTPVVATGYHQDLEKYTNTQLPLSAELLLKPFGPPELAAAIRRATANRRE